MLQSVQTIDSAIQSWAANVSSYSPGLKDLIASQTDGNGDLATAFLESAQRYLNRPAFITDERILTYGDLREMTFAFADSLVESDDWSPGSCVALQLENSAEYIAAFYGSLLAGGVVVPLPTKQTEAWVEEVLTVTRARSIVDKDGLHTGRQRLRSLSVSGSRSSAESLQNLAAVFFTSGSSGTPKGVMLSHGNLLANAVSIQKSLPIESTDRALAILPFCHAFGNSVLQSHLLCGAALVVAGSPTFPESLIEAMQTHGVTSFSGVPQLHQLVFRGSEISSATVPSLRYVTVAGGALRSDLITEFSSRISPAEFYVMYGQTEATARLSCLPSDEVHTRPGSIGKGIPGVTLQVVDERRHQVIPGIVGEIRARGDNIMLGYWNDPDATEEILHENWLYTGDLAMVDEDGFIYPQGRKSQLLKIAGYRIHPAEIEAVITKVYPEVEAIVVPFEGLDGLQRLALFAVPVGGGSLPELQAIRHCCSHQLARFQRPDYIAVIERAPLTPSLKVDRLKLSQWAAEGVRQRSGSPAVVGVAG